MHSQGRHVWAAHSPPAWSRWSWWALAGMIFPRQCFTYVPWGFLQHGVPLLSLPCPSQQSPGLVLQAWVGEACTPGTPPLGQEGVSSTWTSGDHHDSRQPG